MRLPLRPLTQPPLPHTSAARDVAGGADTEQVRGKRDTTYTYGAITATCFLREQQGSHTVGEVQREGAHAIHTPRAPTRALTGNEVCGPMQCGRL